MGISYKLSHDGIAQYFDTYLNYTSILTSAALSFLFSFIQLKSIVKIKGYLIFVAISIDQEARQQSIRVV